MGDWMGGQQQAPNADPSTGMSTQAAAAGQPQGFGAGLTNAINNPLLQLLLGTYAGAVGSPKQEGLGGAIKGGVTGGLSLYNQAQLRQQELPLKQAQLQEAQLTTKKLGRELAPLPKESVDALETAVQGLNQQQQVADAHRDAKGAYDPSFPPPDSTEIASLKTLESQARGNLISNTELMTSLKAIDDSKRYMEFMHGQTYGAQGAMMGQMWPLFQQFLQNQQNQGGQPQPTSSGAAAPPKVGQSFSGTVNGKTVWEKVWTDGKTYYSTDEGKSWQVIPQPTATAP